MQVKKESVRKKIYKAAVKEFKTSGYKNATMRKISLSSGIPIGNLYRYYHSKEILYSAVVEEVHEELTDVFKEGFSEEKESSEEKALYFFNRIIDIYITNYDKTYILLHQNKGTKFENVQRELGELFQEKIIEDVKINRGEIPQEDLDFIKFICRLFLIGVGELISSYHKDISTMRSIGKKFVLFYSAQLKERIDVLTKTKRKDDVS